MTKTFVGFRAVMRMKFEQHYKRNDPAHFIDHADDVIERCFKLTGKNLNLNLDIFIAAGYLHDAFMVFDTGINNRKYHHETASNYATTDEFKYLTKDFLTDEERSIVSRVVFEHRASYTGNYSSIYSEIFAAADRGKPDFCEIFSRALKYSGGDVEKTRNHMKEKFGRDGYAKYPDFYKVAYKEQLENLWEIIDRI